MEKGKEITLKTVLHEINEPGNVFSLAFWTLAGDLSVKEQVKKNPTKASEGGRQLNDLKSIRREINNAGALILYDCKQRHPFEAKIEHLMEYNGYTIFHNF